MRDFVRIIAFVVAMLATVVCAVSILDAVGNPYEDIRKGWAALIAGMSGLVALAGGIGFAHLRLRYPQANEVATHRGEND